MKKNTSILMNTVLCQPDDTWYVYDNEGNVIDHGSDIKSYINQLYNEYSCHLDTEGETNQFSKGRYAIALLEGEYDLEIVVGYYTSIIGLGQKPEDVTINGSVNVPNSCHGHALDNFWRSCEGLQINVPGDGRNYWRVSQAAPFRRNIVNGTLVLGESTEYETGYSSGGYMGECVINKVNGELGNIDFGTQQQFYVGCSEFNDISGGAWNFLLAGSETTAKENTEILQGKKLVTKSGPIEKMAGKPFLMANSLNDFELVIPKVQTNVQGAFTCDDEFITKTKNFSIIDPSVSVDDVNDLLAEGTSIVFSPGIYHYPKSLDVTQDNTVLLGLGFASIIPTQGNTAIHVSGKGCRVAGLMLQAGNKPTHEDRSPSLITVGDADGRSEGDPDNPTILQDLFSRVGGPDLTGECDTMLLINQNHVILDDTWSWRADHTDFIRDGLGVDRAMVNHAVVVNGHDVSAYCLMIEHTLKELCVWNGDRGKIFFIQSELAYDVGDYDMPWDYPALQVNGSDFYGTNLGFYSFFSKKHNATEESPRVTSAVIVRADSKIDSAMTLLLDPKSGGGVITNVINNSGQRADLDNPGTPSWCTFDAGMGSLCDEAL